MILSYSFSNGNGKAKLSESKLVSLKKKPYCVHLKYMKRFENLRPNEWASLWVFGPPSFFISLFTKQGKYFPKN